MVLETLLGSLGGGVLRIMPEVLNWFDRKDARKHELAMQQVAKEFEQLRGAQRMDEIGAENQKVLDEGGLEALTTAIKAQGKQTGIRWVDAINSTVRPVLTYWWCVVGITAAKVSQFLLLKDQGLGTAQSIDMLWGQDEITIVAGMLNFWFLDRCIRKNKGI
jgi:hypothetical protein